MTHAEAKARLVRLNRHLRQAGVEPDVDDDEADDWTEPELEVFIRHARRELRTLAEAE